jgi:hypothetical protein
MRILILLPVLLLAASLPVQAAPPPATSTSTPAPTSTAAPAAPHARSPIGEVMGKLTRALREAAAQQGRTQPASMDAARADASTAATSAHEPTPLPPDATAQAAVP